MSLNSLEQKIFDNSVRDYYDDSQSPILQASEDFRAVKIAGEEHDNYEGYLCSRIGMPISACKRDSLTEEESRPYEQLLEEYYLSPTDLIKAISIARSMKKVD